MKSVSTNSKARTVTTPNRGHSDRSLTIFENAAGDFFLDDIEHDQQWQIPSQHLPIDLDMLCTDAYSICTNKNDVRFAKLVPKSERPQVMLGTYALGEITLRLPNSMNMVWCAPLASLNAARAFGREIYRGSRADDIRPFAEDVTSLCKGLFDLREERRSSGYGIDAGNLAMAIELIQEIRTTIIIDIICGKQRDWSEVLEMPLWDALVNACRLIKPNAPTYAALLCLLALRSTDGEFTVPSGVIKSLADLSATDNVAKCCLESISNTQQLYAKNVETCEATALPN